MKTHRVLPNIAMALVIVTVLTTLLLCLPVAATQAPSDTNLPVTGQTPQAEATKEADLGAVDTVLLYCIDTGTVLRKKNADGKVYPATAVKLMTALLAYERISDLTEEITVTSAMLRGVSGSYYGFSAGDTVSAEDLIKLLLLRKSNDAALILAHAVAGGEDAFVAAMNKKAEELGMKNTFFVNPTGMHDSGMTTTAEDLLKLSLAFYSHSQLHDWSGAGYLSCESLGDRTVYNNNYFLSRYYNGTGQDFLWTGVVDGMINGGTSQSGDLLITSATYKGLHYIVILLGGQTVDDLPAVYSVTRELIEKDTRNFRFVKVLHNADVICELPVVLGDGVDYAAVFPKETLEYYLPKSLDSKKIEKKLKLTQDSLEAPVHEGDKVGEVSVYYDGKLLGKTDLVVRSNITRSGAEYRITQAAKFLQSKKFFVIALVVIGLALIYFMAQAIYQGQKKKRYQPGYKHRY